MMGGPVENPFDSAPPRGRGSARLAVIAAIAAVALAVLGSFGYRWMKQPPQAKEDYAPVADEFLEKIRAGNVGEAWQSTTAEFKSATGKDRFSAFVKSHPALSAPAERTSFQNVTANGLTVGEYTYRATPPKPTGKTTIRVWIAQDNGRWRVDRVFVE
jgi:hypothetical protein